LPPTTPVWEEASDPLPRCPGAAIPDADRAGNHRSWGPPWRSNGSQNGAGQGWSQGVRGLLPGGRSRFCGVKPRVKAWVIFDDRLKFGAGRARLLEAIDEVGSLKGAVDRFAMSYRNAWGYLRDLESAAGFKFVERAPGRGPKGGMRLTPRGRQFVAQFWEFHRALDEASRQRFPRSFRSGSGPPRESGASRSTARARRAR